MARVFQRRPDGIYYLDYSVAGRRIREASGTINCKQAEKYLQSRLGDVVQGKFNLQDCRITPEFSDFCQQYMFWAKVNKRSWQRDGWAICD